MLWGTCVLHSSCSMHFAMCLTWCSFFRLRSSLSQLDIPSFWCCILELAIFALTVLVSGAFISRFSSTSNHLGTYVLVHSVDPSQKSPGKIRLIPLYVNECQEKIVKSKPKCIWSILTVLCLMCFVLHTFSIWINVFSYHCTSVISLKISSSFEMLYHSFYPALAFHLSFSPFFQIFFPFFRLNFPRSMLSPHNVSVAAFHCSCLHANYGKATKKEPSKEIWASSSSLVYVERTPNFILLLSASLQMMHRVIYRAICTILPSIPVTGLTSLPATHQLSWPRWVSCILSPHRLHWWPSGTIEDL